MPRAEPGKRTQPPAKPGQTKHARARAEQADAGPGQERSSGEKFQAEPEQDGYALARAVETFEFPINSIDLSKTKNVIFQWTRKTKNWSGLRI